MTPLFALLQADLGRELPASATVWVVGRGLPSQRTMVRWDGGARNLGALLAYDAHDEQSWTPISILWGWWDGEQGEALLTLDDGTVFDEQANEITKEDE